MKKTPKKSPRKTATAQPLQEQVFSDGTKHRACDDCGQCVNCDGCKCERKG